MNRFLVFDFETTGVGKDSRNGYKPYPPDLAPLPRPNFPVELAWSVVEADGSVSLSGGAVIRGAERLDPFVLENCPHLSVKRCDREGVSLEEAVEEMARAGEGCTLVAHNIAYDVEVLRGASNAGPLLSLPRFCTCVNEEHKKARTAYYFKKIDTWIGPKLEKLAEKHGVPYDPAEAHSAAYDVEVTVGCLRSMKGLGVKAA